MTLGLHSCRQILMKVALRRAIVSLVALLFSASTSLVAGEEKSTSTPGLVEPELIGGTVTTAATHRREVGSWGGCTGTVIAPQWVLVAAHCWDFLDTIDTGSAQHVEFKTSNDGIRWGAGACTECQTIETDRTIALTKETTLGADDIMLVRLRWPVNTSFLTPATIATSAPTSGSVTTWGLGCLGSAGPADGKMRFVVTPAGTPSSVICPGDSGGPRFAGTSRRGPLIGVNSAFGSADGFGDVIGRRAEILNIIRSWSVEGGPRDIGTGAWCMGATQQISWGDVDGTGQPDAICHDSSSGFVWVAENHDRFIRQTFASGTALCNGRGDKIFTGDFDGDGRTDLLCRKPTITGSDLLVFVAQASASSRYRIDLPPYQLLSTAWCTHPTAQLLVGDFDGDRRTDLLCHDLVTGQKWVKYTNAAGRIPDGIGSDYTDTSRWCSHLGAEVFTGDFDRDQKTDLLCFTRLTGYLHVQRSRGRPSPFTEITDSAVSAVMDTGAACSVDTECLDGQKCEFGMCRERLCARSGRLMIGDFSGDGVSDIICEYPTGRTFGVRPFAGLPSATDGRAILQSTGGYFVGWGGKLRLRSLRASTQSWMER